MLKIIEDEQFLQVLRQHKGEHMPVRRLAKILGYSESTTHTRLKDLEYWGKIKIKVIRETHIDVVN